MTNIIEINRTANQQLADSHWAVRIGRDLIEKHCNSADFGALVAFAGVLAWRDRGPGWWIDDKRSDASTPPGGWPRLIGVTPPTWRVWRDRAIAVGLLSEEIGERRSGARVKTLRPGKPYRTEEQDQGYEIAVEQFARIPCAVLFDATIGRTAKRVLMALALFRSKKGFACVAVPTIARVAGLHERNAQRGLRQLELAGAVKSTGLDRRVRTYEVVDNLEVIHIPGESQRHQGVKASATRGGKPAPPGVKASATRGESQRHQVVKASVTLSGASTKKIPQENKSRKNLQGKPSGAERLLAVNGPKPFRRRQNPQKDLVLMRVFEGKKAARQDGAIVTSMPSPEPPAPELTPDERRDKVAKLETLLAPMKHTDAGFTVLTETLAEHVAALGGDTELRKSA